MEIEIRKLEPHDTEDFVELIKVFAVVFEMNNLIIPGKTYLNNLLGKPDFVVVIAKHDDKIIGGLTVYILQKYYSVKPAAYIYDVGIVGNYQRRGVGKKLISYLLQYCKENGFEEAYVEAEITDTHAIDFYRTTPVDSELQATHFTYSFFRGREKRL
jgi:aminoglycoside 3-N-acetyltransferase I